MVAIGRMQGFFSDGGIECDGWTTFSFNIHFCVRRIRSLKDLGISVIEKMLIFATVVFPKIHSCLIVSFELRFLNIYTSVCLMNDEALILL